MSAESRCAERFVFRGASGQPDTESRCRLELGHGKVHECRSPKGGIIKWRKKRAKDART